MQNTFRIHYKAIYTNIIILFKVNIFNVTNVTVSTTRVNTGFSGYVTNVTLT